MPYLKPQETDLLKLPSNPEYWVRMRKRAPFGVRNDASSRMMKIAARGIGEDNGDEPSKVSIVSEAEWGGYIRALITGFITEWNLTDEEDRPLSISEESIDLLEDEDGQFLAQEAQARSRPRSVKQEKNLETLSRRRSLTNRK